MIEKIDTFVSVGYGTWNILPPNFRKALCLLCSFSKPSCWEDHWSCQSDQHWTWLKLKTLQIDWTCTMCLLKIYTPGCDRLNFEITWIAFQMDHQHFSLEVRGLTKSCSWLVDHGVKKTQPNCFNQITCPWTMNLLRPVFFHGGMVRCQKSRFRPAMMFFGMFAIGTHLSFMFLSLAQSGEGFCSKLISRTREESLPWSNILNEQVTFDEIFNGKPCFPCKYQPKAVNFPVCHVGSHGVLLEWYFHFNRWVV